MSKKNETPAETPKRKKKTRKKSAKPQRGLGRGLSALMADVNMDQVLSEETSVPVAPETKDMSAAPETKSDDPLKRRSLTNADDVYDYYGIQPPSEEEEEAAKEKARQNFIDQFGIDPVKMMEERKAQKLAEAAPVDINTNSGVTYVDIGQLERNPEQPRRHFDTDLLLELADSIKRKGVLQPILVRPIPDRTKRNKPVYQIVAGERRWQAAGKAGLDRMPVFIREITDLEALEIGVIENVQRAELNPMEEALAYKALLNEFGRTQAEVGQAVGKSRSYITNMLRLLTLPEQVQAYLAHGELSIGHARAMAGREDAVQLADMAVENKLSVRDVEGYIRKLKTQADKKITPPTDQKSPDIRRLEAQIMDALGLAVDLRHKGQHGELRLKYKDDDQLEMIIKRLVNG